MPIQDLGDRSNVEQKVAYQTVFSDEDLIKKGEKKSSLMWRAINVIFGAIPSVKASLNKRFKEGGIKQLKKENWLIAKDLMHPRGKVEKKELKNLVKVVVPENERLGKATRHYKQMEQWRMRQDLKDEIALQPELPEWKGAEMENEEPVHWIQVLASRKEMELEKFLESGDLVESLNTLNILKKESKTVDNQDFIRLVEKAAGQLGAINNETVNSVKETLNFIKESPILEGRDQSLPKLKPDALQPAVKKYNEALKKATDLKFEAQFNEFSKEALEAVADKDFPPKMERFGKEMSSFFSCFEGDVNMDGVTPDQIKELHEFFKERLKVTDSKDNLAEATDKFKARIVGMGIAGSLANLREKKEKALEAAKAPMAKQMQEAKEAAQEVKESVNTLMQEAFGVDVKTLFSTEVKNLTHTQKTEFTAWLKDKGMNDKDMERLFKFLEKAVGKNGYSATILKEGLKKEIELKGTKKTMDGLFAKDWFGNEKDLLDVFILLSDGKKALFKQCFQLEVREIVTNVIGSDEVATPGVTKFGNEMIALFKNQDQMINRNTLQYVGELVDFSAHLAEQKYPFDAILEEVKSQAQDGLDLDNIKEVHLAIKTKIGIINALKDQQAVDNVAQQAVDNVAPQAVDNVAPQAEVIDQVIDIEKQSDAYQKIVGDPIGLTATLVSTFITTLFPTYKAELENELRGLQEAKLENKLKKVALQDKLDRVDDDNEVDKAILELELKELSEVKVKIEEKIELKKAEIRSKKIEIQSEKKKGIIEDKKRKAEMEEDLRSFGPILNPLVRDALKDVKPEFVEKVADVAKSYKGNLLGGVILGTTPAIKALSLSFVRSIMSANALYKRAKAEEKNLNTADEATVKELGGTVLEQMLILKLDDISFIINSLQKINGFNAARGIVNVATKVGLSTLGNTIIGFVTRKFLEDNNDLTGEEKTKVGSGVSKLVKTLLPLLPELLQKHDIDAYAAFITDLKAIVLSDEKVEEKVVTAKIDRILSQLLDKELPQYISSISASLESVGDALEK